MEKNNSTKKTVKVTKKSTEKKTTRIENKRMVVVFGVILLLVLMVIIANVCSRISSSKVVEAVENALGSTEPQMVYIMKDGCSYCELNEPNMQSLKDEYNVDYLEIDTSKLTTKDTNKILSLLNVDTDDFGTPYLTVVQNNEVLGNLNGVQSYNGMFKFLQEKGIIAKDEKLAINYIGYSDYKKLIKSDKNQIIVLTSSTCHYCLGERPILDEIAKEYNITINWMYMDYAFTSGNEESEYTEFQSSLQWFTDNSDWGTPTTLIVKKGTVVSSLTGYREKDELIKFYQQNGFINE